MIDIAQNWKDYELIDAGEEEKLERWGKYILRRPDPQAIWDRSHDSKTLKLWNEPDMFYHRSSQGGGNWENNTRVPEGWLINYKELKFNIRPTAFKHTGLFPEQASNWEWLINKIRNSKSEIRILNLFAYTGGATVACMYAGAHVTHVDASKGMTQVAKQNIEVSKLDNTKVRFIVDDAVKFVEREIKRGNSYDGIIMDPPAYGRGPTGQLWEIERDLTNLVDLCTQILSGKPLFFLINAYATTFSSIALENILEISISDKFEGKVTSGELGLKMSSRDLVLPCGLFARWED
jgi:23S rRNA (cytosine1962-C5)-methyltransferase